MSRLFCLLLRAALLLVPVTATAQQLQLELPSGAEIVVEVYEGQSAATILWLPSERGFDPAHREHARALAALGHPVWLADLHDAYFVQAGRSSIPRFPLDDVIAVVDAAARASGGRLILLSASRGAQLALIAAREWQLRNPGNGAINGIILAHAHLYESRPAPGKNAAYLPIVQATNIPLYLLVAQYSTKYSRLQELATELGSGGSTVYTQVLAGVQGGFHTRDAARSSAADLAARQAFASTLSRAAGILQQAAAPTVAARSSRDTRRFSRDSKFEPVLAEVSRPLPAPALRLADIDGDEFSLERYRGKVLLVNFWASWCRPCVEEIPSLHRLDAALEGSDFKIITVNVGEEQARISQFLQQVPVELPVLMDYDASISKDWMIYVYPSSYLIDRQGNIRYAYLGALEWDSAENIGIIRNLLDRH